MVRSASINNNNYYYELLLLLSRQAIQLQERGSRTGRLGKFLMAWLADSEAMQRPPDSLSPSHLSCLSAPHRPAYGLRHCCCIHESAPPNAVTSEAEGRTKVPLICIRQTWASDRTCLKMLPCESTWAVCTSFGPQAYFVASQPPTTLLPLPRCVVTKFVFYLI